MKAPIYLLLSIFCLACQNDRMTNSSSPEKPREVLRVEWESLLAAAELQGAFLIFDPQRNAFYSNDFSWCQERDLPASTYKIPHSIIALETGVVADQNTLFTWDGEPRQLKIWEQDLNFRQAFHYSCVPCYQSIARQIGPERMKEHLQPFNYGYMQFDSSNIDRFWLEGESQINQWGQIDFLRRFFYQELPISERTYGLMRDLMLIDQSPDYRLSGKTGWAIRDGQNSGWFVGYLERGEAVYFFATRVIPLPGRDMDDFSRVRRSLTEEVLRDFLAIGSD